MPVKGDYKYGIPTRAMPEYNSWALMRDRCLNEHGKNWRYYGGRGIKIDPRWNDFTIFLKDMGYKPSGYTLERVNGNGDYTKANCVWATRRAQAQNRVYAKLSIKQANAIRRIYAKGGIRQVDLAKQYGVSQRTISLITRNESWLS